jgi:thiamine-monophosphate kinase
MSLQVTKIGTFASGSGLQAISNGSPVNLPETLGFEHG